MKPIQFVTIITILVLYEANAALLQLPKVQTCYSDAECGTGECCAKKLQGPIIMSRDVHTTPDPATVKGTCSPYLKLKERCAGVWGQHGQCGCAPDLLCHWHPPANIGTLGKRKITIGDYFCEPKDMA